MEKRILKKIAKEWAKSILLATEHDCEELEGVITVSEENYIVEEVKRIAERITKESYLPTLESIVSKYYEYE